MGIHPKAENPPQSPDPPMSADSYQDFFLLSLASDVQIKQCNYPRIMTAKPLSDSISSSPSWVSWDPTPCFGNIHRLCMVLPGDHPSRTEWCTCTNYCYGGHWVTRRTFFNHAQARAEHDQEIRGRFEPQYGPGPVAMVTLEAHNPVMYTCA